MLTQKDKKKRYNKKANTSSTHVFDAWGDRYDSKFMKNSANTAQEALSGSNLGGSIAGIAGGIGGIVEAGMANAQIADTTEQKQEAEDRANWQSSASDTAGLLNEMASDVQLNENIDWRSIRGSNGWQQAGNILKGAISGASAGAKVGGGLGAIVGGIGGIGSGLAGLFIGNNKAKTEAGEISQLNKNANLAKAQTLTHKAAALDQQQDAAAQRAYAAYGGDINTPKFSDFPSEITEFNTGGSHEENPYDGIPQGIAPDGLPNLVEEGEVKYDNYIFSDRLMLNKNDKKKYKFLKGKTYADAAKAIKKELGIDERPNDLIAKTDLEEHLNILSTLQEEERAKRGLRGENRMMYKNGGHMFRGDEYDDSAYEKYGYSPQSYTKTTPVETTGYTYSPTLTPETRKFPTSVSSKKTKTSGNSSNWNSILQAAPAITSSISGLVQSFQGHDRSIANKLYNYEPERSYTKAPQVTTPKVNISKYKIDEEQAARENDAMVLATMRAARESSTNPLAAMNPINAASYAGQIASGKARSDAKKANFDIEMAGNQFNLGIDQLQGNFDLAANKLNAAERDTYNKLKYQALATGASADIRSKESYEDALGKTWTSAAENMNILAHDKIYNEMVAEYLKNKNAALGGPLSIQKSKNKIRGKKRNRLV